MLLREKPLHGDACAGALFAHQKGFLLQRGERDFALVRKWVAGWRDHHQRIVHERFGYQMLSVRRQAHDDQVFFVGGELAQQGLAVGHVQAHGDITEALGKDCEQLRCEIVGGARH